MDRLSRTDRELDCQKALEADFHALASRAEAAGWKSGEVAGALLALAMANIKAKIGSSAVGRALKATKTGGGEH